MTPKTFEEAQSRFYGKALTFAGIATGIAVVALIAVLIWGGWPESLYGQIVTILGIVAGGAQVTLLYVIHALAIGGPVQNSTLSFGRDGASFKTEGDAR